MNQVNVTIPEVKSQKVSVIIPCYNHAQYLSEAVDSVINQTFMEFEIIIVNDGSTDNTIEVAHRLINKYPNVKIRLINQANAGPQVSRNNGIKESSSSIMYVLDADDKIKQETIETLYEEINKDSKIGLVYSDYQIFGEEERIMKMKDFDSNRLLIENNVSGNNMFRKSAWEDAGGYNPNMKYGCEDWDFYLSIHEKGWHIRHVNKVLYSYRRVGTSFSHKFLAYDSYSRARLILNHKNLYSNEKVASAEKILSEYKQAEQLGSLTTGPVVSVIINSCSDISKLKEAIISLKNQTYQNFELMVYGKENHVKVLLEQIKFEKKAIIIKTDLRKDKTIRAANGKYIAYLGERTKFYREHLSTLVEALERERCSVAYTDAYVYERKPSSEHGKSIIQSATREVKHQIRARLFNNSVPIGCFMHLKDSIFLTDSFASFDDWKMLDLLARQNKLHHVRKVTCETVEMNTALARLIRDILDMCARRLRKITCA